MKKTTAVIAILSIFGIFTSVKAQPVQYFMQRSSVNVASMSEVRNLQLFLAGTHSFVGFEGAPKNILLNIATPMLLNDGKKYSDFLRHFAGGTVVAETYGAHTVIRATFGYNYRLQIGKNTHLSLGLATGIKQNASNYTEIQSDERVYSHKETHPAFQVGTRLAFGKFNFSVFGSDQNFFGELVWGHLWESEVQQSYKKEKMWQTQIALQACYDRLLQSATALLSANFIYCNKLGFGIGYQTDKDVFANVNIKISRHFWLGYAYKLQQFGGLAAKHEIAVQVSI